MSTEQTLRDKINLSRFVKRLELNTDNLHQDARDGKWINAQGRLQVSYICP
jgi:hypothetical protein